MFAKRHQHRLTMIMAIVTLSTMLVILGFLYLSSYEQQKQRLLDITQSQAILIESIIHFDSIYNSEHKPVGAIEDSLFQVEAAFKAMEGFGKSGELMLVQHSGQKISVILGSRHSNQEINNPDFQRTSQAVQLYNPVTQNESGILEGTDHHGNSVVAAYARVGDLNYSIIAKLDTNEINKPFLISTAMSFAIACILLLIGSSRFSTHISPMVKQLEESEEKLRLLLSASSEPIYSIDLDGNCSFANPATAKLLGYTVKEMLGKNTHSLFHYAHKDGSPYAKHECKIYKAHLKGETSHVDNEVYWKKDGTPLPVEYFSEPIFREGHIVGTVVTFKDITERKEAERALAESEERYRTTFEKAFVGIATLSLVGKLEEVNQHFCDITGYSKKELLTKTFMDISHEDEIAIDLQKIKELIDGKSDTFNREKRYIHKQGHIVWANLSVTLLKNSDDTPKGFIAAIVDITDKKKTEQALEKAQEAHSQAEMITHFGHWDWDIANGDLAWTDEIYRIFGVAPQEFPATYEAFLNTIHPDDRKRVINAVNQAVCNPDAGYALEHRVVHPNGKQRIVHEQGTVYRDDKGNPIRMIGTVHDITERKLAEQELQKYRNHLEELVNERTSELEAAQEELLRKGRLATLGHLTATVGHELRNPLAVIRPSLHIVQKHLETDDVKAHRALERINRNIERCDAIIDELLDFTRINKLSLQAVDLDSWLDELIAEQNLPDNILINKQLTLEHQKIAIDAGRFRRVLINVIDNACHAMDEHSDFGGQHTLSLTSRKTDKRIEIIVKDTGSGIPEEILPKIFEPLYSTKGFGVGLGMPTVKQIMEQHHGGIEVNSICGQGTTITLWLPQQSIVVEAA